MKQILLFAFILLTLLLACSNTPEPKKQPFLVLLNFNGYDPAEKVWSQNPLPASGLSDSAKQVLVKRLDSLYSNYYVAFTEDRDKFNQEPIDHRAQVTITSAPDIETLGVSYYNGVYLGDTTASFVNSFYGSYEPRMLAVVVAHELGHTLGLAHQSNWVGVELIDTYNPGDSNAAPIMGYVSTLKQEPKWTTGTNAFGQLQDDNKILTEILGVRPKRFKPKY